LAVYTTAARAAGATEDVMTTYLPIILGRDALQWLRHLPRQCIDDWSEFSRCFITNFQSLSDKPAQPWDLKSIRRRGDETLRSYLKRFQTMRNRIPKVVEAAVIKDFYRGSNDSAFVRAILQKAPTTSEQLFREADLYITADKRAQDLIGGAKSTPPAPRRNTNQQPDKRWEKRPREEIHTTRPPAFRAQGAPRGGERTLDDILDAQCLYHKDMCHTLRNCRDFKHSIGNGRPFQPLPPPPPQGGPGEPRQPQQQEGEEAEHSHASTEKSTSSSADMGRKKARGSRSSTSVRYWWRPPVLPPRIDGPNTRSPSLGQISGSTSITRANTCSSSIR
jgi:hypothetical protein